MPATCWSTNRARVVFLDFGIAWAGSTRAPAGCFELVHALLVKKDHAAAGKIVVLLGAVGTTKPEAQAARDLGRSPNR